MFHSLHRALAPEMESHSDPEVSMQVHAVIQIWVSIGT